MRYRQVVIICRVFFVILILSLFYSQVIKGERYYRLSRRNVIRIVPLDAVRGRILDRNNIILADTKLSFNVSIIPQEAENNNFIFKKLSGLLNISFQNLLVNYRKNFWGQFNPVKIYENLSKDEIISIEENKFQLPGVIIDAQSQRVYPFANIASHVLGYLGEIDSSRITKLKPYGYGIRDVIGYSGVEQYYDLILRGEKGGEQIEVDNRGQKVRTIGYKPAQSGNDIQITIDIRIQETMDKFMQDKKGAVVMMDPYTGEILALGSYPNYDPNQFIKGSQDAIISLLNDSKSPLFNRAVLGQYPPGSIFKIIMAMSALEKDFNLTNKTFLCDGNMRLGNRNFNCWSVHEIENLRDAMVHSCNVYFYNLGILIGPDLISSSACLFGLGKQTGVDFNFEAKGFIPSPKLKRMLNFQGWFKGDTANMAIGQGDVLVTPLQMARLVSVFANGGNLVKPYLIKSVDDKQVVSSKPRKIKLSGRILEQISNFLFEVINDSEGTANITKIDGLNISGKTGTAQVSGSSAHGWFVGYVGRDKPKYAFCIFLENGGSSYAACVVAKNIFEEMLDKDLF